MFRALIMCDSYSRAINSLLSCKQWRRAPFYTFRYSGAHTMLIQCSFNSLQDRQRSSLNVAYQYVNFMRTLDLSRVELTCRSKVLCMDDMILLRVCPWALIYPILDKAQSTRKDEIKSTPLILQTAKDGRKGQVSHPPRPKMANFWCASFTSSRVHFASIEG